MQNIDIPKKFEVLPGEDPQKASIVIEPCYPGYGTTLGNALRRVLLSSLPGAAVTSVKIKNAPHEFSTLEHVKEDILEIILNLKQLRLKIFSEEPVKLNLKVKGEKEVKAGDIEKNAQVEIVNADLVIATLNDKNTELEMEISVARGRGYVPTEARDQKEKLETGNIAIDSIFSPIKNVSLDISNVRVGQMTNWEKLVLNLETDGSITPEDAITQAAKLLADHFDFILNPIVVEAVEGTEEEPASSAAADTAGEGETAETAPEPALELPEESEKTPEEKKEDEEAPEKPKKKRGRPKKKEE